MSGCRDCKYMYKRHGDVQCQWEPHRYVYRSTFRNTDQAAIVSWLSTPGRNAWEDPGCPRYVYDEEAKMNEENDIVSDDAASQSATTSQVEPLGGTEGACCRSGSRTQGC